MHYTIVVEVKDGELKARRHEGKPPDGTYIISGREDEGTRVIIASLTVEGRMLASVEAFSAKEETS